MGTAAKDQGGWRRFPCTRSAVRGSRESSDVVVVEEPLELRVDGSPVATLMRTPGSDRHLALGFFVSEGWISTPADVGALQLCARTRGQEGDGGEPAEAGTLARAPGDENVANLIPAEGAPRQEPQASPRLLPATSSCGICGKRTVEEVLALKAPVPRLNGAGAACPPVEGDGRFPERRLLRMPEVLLERQVLFHATGALHAAGLFAPSGELLRVEEDVGRHNAVDKVVGWAFLEGRLPLSTHALQVSGRISFEIVQKAYRAGIPLIAAISGVSSLGLELALQAGMTLVGFMRRDSFTVYSAPERIFG